MPLLGAQSAKAWLWIPEWGRGRGQRLTVRGLVLCFVPRLRADAKIKLTDNAEHVTNFLICSARSQYLEPQFYFSRMMLRMNPIFCVFTRAIIAYYGSWYLWCSQLTGKTHVYRTGTINISTWIPFCKTNARRNLDLERQKSLFLQILGRFVALLPKRNGSIGLWRFTFAT